MSKLNIICEYNKILRHGKLPWFIICCANQLARQLFPNEIGADQAQELRTGGQVLELTGKRGSGSYGILFLYAAHHHTEVLRLDHYSHSFGLQRFLDGLEDLVCKALLYLQPAGKYIHYPCDLTKTCDITIGD